MDFLGIIIDAFRAVFKTENVLVKHISLFALTGLMAVNSSSMKTLTSFSSTATDVSQVFFPGLLGLILCAYFIGYSIKFMHNSFGFETIDIMPDIDLNPFGIFFGVLPLFLLWFVYIALTAAVAIIPFLGWLIAIFCVPLMCIYLTFIYIAYSKEYRANGLFNLFIPFIFAKHSVGSMFVFGLIFIPIYIVCFLPVILLVIIFTVSGNEASSFELIISILSGYLGCVVQLVWTYCMVQVYKEKVEPNLDLD